MVNPFDPRAVLLAKHAQHVVLIHFPIALFMTGVALDVMAGGKRESTLSIAAYINISIAAVAVLPTIVTGLLAWQFALDGKRFRGILLWHAVAASFSAVLIVLSWWLHWRSRKNAAKTLPRYRIPVELLGVGLIAVTAHLGGYLSGVNF